MWVGDISWNNNSLRVAVEAMRVDEVTQEKGGQKICWAQDRALGSSNSSQVKA